MYIVNVLLLKGSVIVQRRLVRIDNKVTLDERRDHCDKDQAYDTQNQSDNENAGNLSCFTHRNSPSELDFRGSLDLFFELEILKL